MGGDLLNQRHDVTHAQQTACMALGIKGFKPVDFFTGAGELDRRPRDLAHRQGRTASCIAIGFGQHNARERQRIFESLGSVNRILSQHGVHHKKGFHRLNRRMQRLDLIHQRLVDG